MDGNLGGFGFKSVRRENPMATHSFHAAEGTQDTAPTLPPAPDAEGRLKAVPEAEAGAGSAGKLVVMSMNVWFDPQHQRERLAALLDIVLAHAPDVVCLQEMTKQAAAWLLEDPRVRAQYAATDPAFVTRADNYGVMMLVRAGAGGGQ